jgi:DNA primase
MPAEAEEGWWHIFGFLNVDRLREEVDLARQEMAKGLTGETQRRLERLKDALNKVSAGEPDGLAAA